MTCRDLAGKPAFRGASNQQLNMRIVRASHEAFSPASPAAAKGLIKRLLVLDPTRRLKAPGVLAHPWHAPFRRDRDEMRMDAAPPPAEAPPRGHLHEPHDAFMDEPVEMS